jgi:putative hemolysin
MSDILTEVVIILLLLALNGVFAMSELAIVTARKVRLEQRAENGDAGARAALRLAQDPTQFLSTVQVGITLIGVLAGAFGGATIAENLASALARAPALTEYADALGLGIVVAGITYLSLLIGELVPKRVALSHPERVASLVARPMRLLSRVAAPLVSLLTGPTNLVLRLFGLRVSSEPSITVEEIRSLVEQGAESGVVEDTEQQMVEGVFRLGDRLVSDLMTPRTQLEWIDVSETPERVRGQVMAQVKSHFLVCEGTVDNVLGVVFAEDLLAQCLAGKALDLRVGLRQPLYMPAAMTALTLLERLRSSRQRVAVALDEFGGLQGVVFLDDLVETVVGDLPLPGETTSPPILRKDEATWVVHGSVPLEDVEATLDLSEIPEETRGGVRTLGGLVMALLGRVPAVGDVVQWDGMRAEVAAMDGRRVEKVVVSKVAHEKPETASPSSVDSEPRTRSN